MRIAVLTSLYPSPARPLEGIFAERRWRGMAARGHGVRVVQPLPLAPPGIGPARWREIARAPRRERRLGIEVARPRYLHVAGHAAWNARAFAARGVRAILAEEAPEVAVLDYAWPAAAAAPALSLRGIPALVCGRGSDVLEVARIPSLRAGLERGLRAAGHWCAVSRDLVAAMDKLGGEPGRGRLVPNGVDLGLFALAERGTARARLGLEIEGELVLVVGHLIERKDPLLALRAFERWRSAAASRARSSLTYLGRGPLEPAVRAEAARLGLAGAVHLPGEVPPEELARWYAACDLVLLTSTREGRPNVVLEALACGRPVVATEAGGTAEVLCGLEGMLARTREPAELAAAMEAILRAAPDPARLRAHVAPLSWDASLDALERSLEEAIGARGEVRR